MCLAGDCGNCLAEVDGVSYVRTCQAPARAGLRVTRHPAGAMPALPVVAAPDLTATPLPSTVEVHHLEVDVAVVGGGSSGRAAADEAERAGRSVRVFDAHAGDEVVAIYAGPLIVVRTEHGMLHVHPREIVVASGAAEVHPVCPGNRLAGIVTARAAEKLQAAGVELGRLVAVGGGLVRFEGEDGRVRAVVTADPATGAETTTPADTVAVGLGLAPRDLLARMAGAVPVTVVGDAATDQPLPPPRPRASSVAAWARPSPTSPTPGTAASPSSSCSNARARPVSGRARAAPACRPSVPGSPAGPGTVPDPFTARPASRQITLAEAAADSYVDAFRKTPLHDEHLAAGARMDRFGGWWRPWHYGDAISEYWAVREGVSIGDVSTLGKLVVSGPDVVELLERIYPCHVADIEPGRSRYALLLNERGHVMDDGMILRESETRFVLSFTSGGAANAEMWLRDWIEVWGLRVHLLDRTMSLAAINVTGPLARTLLVRAGLADPPRFLGHVHADVAGVPCHVMRLSFTGEAAFELHHPVDRSVELWRALMAARQRPRDPAARPPGAVRAAAREGPRHRRDGHRARHDAAPAGDGLGGPDGEAAVHRPGRRWSGPRSSPTSGAGSGSPMDGAGTHRGRRRSGIEARSSGT